MKILLISHEYPPNVTGGLGNYARNLVNELIQRGNEVLLITQRVDGTEAFEKKDGLKIIRLELPKSEKGNKIFPNFMDNRYFFNLRMAGFADKINFNEFDLMHVMDDNDGYFLNSLSQKPTIPIITSLNSYYAISTSLNPFKFYNPWHPDAIIKYIYYNIIKRKIIKSLKYSHKLVANSRRTMQVVSESLEFPKERYSIIHRGIDVKFFSQKAGKNKYKSQEVLFVGKNMERKGAIYLIEAIDEVVWSFPNAHLTMIGLTSALYRRKINKLIRKCGLEKNITIIPHVDNEKLLPYYKKANVFVMPSLIEGLGQCLLEAMAARTPVIGTNVGGIPEVITSDCGFVVPARDSKDIAQAIIDLFFHPEKARKMGNKGFERVKKYFNKDMMNQKTIDIYNEVVK